MTKPLALIALSLALEAAFLFQITVIARPERRAVAAPVVAQVEAEQEREAETVAQALAPAPRF